MSTDNLVTICIATYNRMHLLPKTVSAVLRQTYQDIELIIVNDCSPDDTERVVAELMRKDSRIRTIKHEVNKGLAAARNTAIFNAKGKYFTFIDDDDEWREDYVEAFVKVAENYDDNWCFCCGYSTTDAIGQSVHNKFDHLEGKLIDYIQAGFTPPVASQFYYTSTLQKAGGYHEKVRSGVDHDLWLTLAFNEINLKSVDQYLSLPAEVMTVSRGKMTNTYDKRMMGLRNSFELWKEDLVKHFGEAFYRRFVDAYVKRERKKFFRLCLFKFKFLEAAKLYKVLGADITLKEAIKSVFIAVIVHLKIPIRREKFGTIGPGLKL